MYRNLRIYSSLKRVWMTNPTPTANPWPTPLSPGLLHPDWREQQNPGIHLVAGGAGCPVVSTPQCVLSAPVGQINEQVSDRSVSHVSGVRCKTLMSDWIIYNHWLCTAPSSNVHKVSGNSKCQIHIPLPTTANLAEACEYHLLVLLGEK